MRQWVPFRVVSLHEAYVLELPESASAIELRVGVLREEGHDGAHRPLIGAPYKLDVVMARDVYVEILRKAQDQPEQGAYRAEWGPW